MPRPYTQLLLVNMLLATLLATSVMGAPLIPTLTGAIGAGALLYAARVRRDRLRATTTAAARDSAAAKPAPSKARGELAVTPAVRSFRRGRSTRRGCRA